MTAHPKCYIGSFARAKGCLTGGTKAGGEMTESGWPEEMRVAIVADAERGRAIAEILRAGTASEGGDSALSMGEKALVVEVLREASQLRDSLGPGRWDVVVVDPDRVLQDAALVPILAADTNARAGPGPRIVLYADVAAAALRGIHAIAMRESPARFSCVVWTTRVSRER